MREYADIRSCAEALSHLSGVPMRLLSADGTAMAQCGASCDACAFFQEHFSTRADCQELRRRAAIRARDVAETYIFSCPMGLCNAVKPIAETEGVTAVLAGPFLLESIDTLFIQELANRYDAPLSALLDLYEKAQSITVLAPARANALSRLMNRLFPDGAGADARRRRTAMQQRRIGESIQAYKGFSEGVPAYPYEQEQELMRYVEAGNVQEASRILNDLLGYALFSTGGALETVKCWAAELCALLSRAASHDPAGTGFRMNHTFMRSLWEADSTETLALLLQELVERFCQSVFPGALRGDKGAVMRAVRYIELHYAENLTLAQVARNVYLSPSYLSTLFRKTMGLPFSEYLTNVRISEAKRQLSRGWESVTEVAYAVGFDSQSYFSKVFRRVTGVSPSDFQRQAHEGRGDA